MVQERFKYHKLLAVGLAALAVHATQAQMKMPGMKHDASMGKFRVHLITKPAKTKARAPTQLALTVIDAKGKAVLEFAVAHTKLMHLIVVSKDLAYFAHIHPAFRNGKFVVTQTFPFGGPFRLFADFTPKGGAQQVVPVDVMVQGAPHKPVALAPDRKLTKTFGKYLVTLMATPQRLRAGGAATLTFAVSSATTKQRFKDLEDYLGARGHCVILREGAQQFIHAHPMEDQPTAHAKRPMGAKIDKSEVMFHATFPGAGLYKVWAQMKRQGKAFTANYVVKVE